MSSRKWGITALVVVVAVVAVVGALYWQAAVRTAPAPSSTAAPPVAYAVALTDPPVIPAGTSALLINYNGVAVHTEEYGWISNASATGIVNLLGLQNISYVIARVNVTSGAVVNVVRLYISNASIMVDGTQYPVMLPSGILDIPITGASRAAQGALVDLQPRVIEAYVGDQPVFMMAPAAVAVPLNRTAPPGTIAPVPAGVRGEFERASANVTITSATIQVVGNETIISITVANEGSEPVQVLGMGIDGNWSMGVPPIEINVGGVSATIQVSGATAGMHMVFFANGTQLVPALEMAAPHVTVRSPLPPNAHRGNMTPMSGGWGNAAPPAGWGQFANWTPPAPPINSTPMPRMPVLRMPGYTLGPGQSATFTFEGTITLGPRMGSGGSAVPVTITITPIAGQSYGITVMTIPASNATATATAS
jgi:hypothetical protein